MLLMDLVREEKHNNKIQKINKMAEEKSSFFQSATGIAISIGVLFATIWVASKAWKSGQK